MIKQITPLQLYEGYRWDEFNKIAKEILEPLDDFIKQIGDDLWQIGRDDFKYITNWAGVLEFDRALREEVKKL